MKKNKGYVLVETIVVTAFVAGILIFLFIQFSNISSNYNNSYNYNTVENLYSLRNIRDYIESDNLALTDIESHISNYGFIDITNCDIFNNKNYCLRLFELENLETVIVTNNYFKSNILTGYDENFMNFINKISGTKTQKYRIIAQFNNSTYATLRFGE